MIVGSGSGGGWKRSGSRVAAMGERRGEERDRQICIEVG